MLSLGRNKQVLTSARQRHEGLQSLQVINFVGLQGEGNGVVQLTIFYDSQCPLCDIEMRHLRAADRAGVIAMEDIHASGFGRRFPHIDRDRASAVLHGQLADGQVLLGLDVTHRAWSLVGRGWLTAPLRWPLLRLLSDGLYRWFARHRYGISRVLTGQARCDKSCSVQGDRAGPGRG